MPQQNDFSQGPFTEQLMQPYRAPQVPITGFEGPASAIAHIATNFLEGASKARMRKFQMQENQRVQGIKALGNLMQMAQGMGLTPKAQESFVRNVSQEYLRQVSNADTGESGGAKGGNPMANFFKGIATNLLGGESPVKVKPIDQQQLGAYFTALQDESQFPRMATVQAQMQKDLEEAWNAAKDPQTGMVSEQALFAQPAWGRVEALSAEHGVPIPESFKTRLSTLANPQEMMFSQGAAQYNKLMGGGQAPGATTAEPPTPASASRRAEVPATFLTGNAPIDAAINRMGTAPRDIQPIAPMQTEPPTPQGQQPSSVASVANAAGSILGEPVEITPSMMLFRRQMGMGTPNEYFLYKSPTEHIAVQDYGNGLVVEQGTGRRVNQPLASQLGYAVRTNLPTPPKTFSPEEVQATRTQADSILSTVPGMPEQMKSRLLAGFQGQVASGDLKGAIDGLRADVTRWETSENAKKERAVRFAETAQRAAESRGLREESFIQGMRKEISDHDDVVNYRNINGFYNTAFSAYNRVGQSPNPGYEDLALIRALAKITDPVTGVRDAEMSLFTAAQGLLGAWETKVTQGWRNGAVLTPEARKEILTLAKAFRDTARKQAVEGIAPILEQSRSRKIPDSSLIPSYLRASEAASGYRTPEQMLNASPFPPKAPTPQGSGARGRL